ncbi:MAG: copper resistance protein [Chloroflexota bacterium]|nr:copper resistance protein [Chloroflexota bacterium]
MIPVILLHGSGFDDLMTLGIGLVGTGVFLLLVWRDKRHARSTPSEVVIDPSRGVPLRRLQDSMFHLALIGSAVVIAAGLAMVGLGLAGSVGITGSAAGLQSPIPVTAESLARGRAVYDQGCAVCHGVDGRGNGPSAQFFDPPPADLRLHMAQGHTDAQLFDWISNGMAGTGMPGFGRELAEDDRWHVINYNRRFST